MATPIPREYEINLAQAENPSRIVAPLWMLSKLHTSLIEAHQAACSCGDRIGNQMSLLLVLIDQVEEMIRRRVRQGDDYPK